MRVLALIALALTAVSAAPRNPQRIVGGSVTSIDNYPEIVAMLLNVDDLGFIQVCGGSILNNRSVLTAAHCTFGDPPEVWRFRAGSTYANSGGVVYNSAEIIIHPGLFDGPGHLANDLSIVRSTTAIVFTNVIRPASIAGPNYFLADNTPVWAAGWGAEWGDIEESGPQSEELRHVQMWTINTEICRARYWVPGVIQLEISDYHLCVGWLDVGGRDQCAGDSGGPLYHNRVQVGVCSFGFGCASPHFPGVNVRLSRHTSWIVNNA